MRGERYLSNTSIAADNIEDRLKRLKKHYVVVFVPEGKLGHPSFPHDPQLLPLILCAADHLFRALSFSDTAQLNFAQSSIDI